MTIFLVDKSAWEWARRDAKASAQLTALVDAGHVLAGSHLTAMELAYSARSAVDHTRVILAQRAARWLPVNEVVMDRALETIALLAKRGQHRTSSPDVIIAATAEIHGATVLHVDSDYERIAAVTGQPMERLPTSSDKPSELDDDESVSSPATGEVESGLQLAADAVADARDDLPNRA